MKDRAMTLRLSNARSTIGALLASAGVGVFAPAALPLLALGVTAAPALAQDRVQAVEPFYVVVTQDQAPLLAGQVETHYRVALLPIGQILRADFSVDGWVLVNYPADATAFIRATEVTPSADGRTVRTSVATRLRAANMESTSAGSWATLLADPLTPLPAGTELRVVGVENRPDGTPGFYRVAAPSQARGSLRAGFFRRASPQEVEAFLNSAPDAPSDPSVPPTRTPDPASPTLAPGPGASPTGEPGTTTPVAPGGSLDTSLLSDPVLPTPQDRPITPASGQPLVINQAGTISGGPSPAAVPPSTDPVVVTIDGLEQAFAEILKQPVRESEVEELIARFDQAITTLGDSREDQRLKTALRQRADVLRLRRDYRDSLIALDEGQRDATAIAERASQRIDWLRTQGGYAVVGRLVASNIYDGSSGPLMYRVVAVNTDVPRTLAYVRMDDAFTLPQLLGKIVGVRGQLTIEPAIGTRIVQAESVDAVEVQN